MLAVTRLHHGGIYVSDIAATRAFYVELLGFHEVARPASFTFPGAWFESGEAQIHAVVELEPGRVAELSRAAPRGRELSEGFWPHLSLQVEDVDGAQAAMEARGVPVVGGPMTRSDGVKQFYILDPDGYMLELWSTPGGTS
jgi:catechol 2,3-dioxygenase-like lactoylglutathione lyase family enzyme